MHIISNIFVSNLDTLMEYTQNQTKMLLGL